MRFGKNVISRRLYHIESLSDFASSRTLYSQKNRVRAVNLRDRRDRFAPGSPFAPSSVRIADVHTRRHTDGSRNYIIIMFPSITINPTRELRRRRIYISTSIYGAMQKDIRLYCGHKCSRKHNMKYETENCK